MPKFNLNEYETVETRITKFWETNPDGRIDTDLVAYGPQFIVKAAVFRNATDPVPYATGYAEETVGSSPVNKTSALENCETSAIGRALANAGFATKGKRPSREEMMKAERAESDGGGDDDQVPGLLDRLASVPDEATLEAVGQDIARLDLSQAAKGVLREAYIDAKDALTGA